MLLRFGVENYRSLRDYQELLLIAANLKDPCVELLPIPNSKEKALPAIGIYGANASGKSNLFHALRFFVDGIRNSYIKKDYLTAVTAFALDPDYKSQSSRFDCDVVIDDTRYHYGYVVNDKEVLEEWLYAFPTNKVRASKQTWFYRDSSLAKPYYFGKALKGLNRTVEELTRKDSLFLSSAAANNHKQLTAVYDFFSNKVVFRSADNASSKKVISEYINSDAKKGLMLKFLRLADTGILNVEVHRDPLPEEAKPFTNELKALVQKHFTSEVTMNFDDEEITTLKITHQGVKKGAVSFDLENESAGTQTLFSLLGPVYDAIHEGGVLVLDEMNSNLHPLVSKAIIKLFASATTNCTSGQLIFATHDTNLLSSDVLRRDQIWFVEKDQTGASHIYPLTNIRTRQSDNIERGYLEGRFGAIPFLVSDCFDVN